MYFGWIKPRIVTTDAPGGCGGFSPPNAPSNDAQRPLLVVDPTNRNRAFLIEYRNPTAAGANTTDVSAPGRGVVIWYVDLVNGVIKSLPEAIAQGDDGVLQDRGSAMTRR